MSGKTYSLEHTILRHCWTVENARVGIISKTTRAGTTGIWPELTTQIYQEWIDAGVCTEDHHFGWTKAPSVNAVTKINSARLRNRFGGESELMLYPIERAEDAAEKLFSTTFSALWLSEGHLYDHRIIFDSLRMQLRQLGVKYDDYRLWVDSNPPKDGKLSWLWDVFFRERNLKPEEFPAFWDDATRAAVQEFQQNSAVFEFKVPENTFLDPRQLANIRATYASDPEGYKRFVLGEWLDPSGEALPFKNVFDPNLHVVGDVSSPNPDDWELLAPTNGPMATREGKKILLISGWDPGESNHAWVAIQPWTDANNLGGFDIVEEHVVLKDSIPLDTFTKDQVMPKMKALEEFAGFPLTYTNFADGSTERFRAQVASDGITNKEEHTDAGIITAASGGTIRLVGSNEVKKAGWQKRRVDLLIRLLRERRIRISAHCVHTIDMFKRLRKDMSDKAKTYLEPQQEVKHVFDAISYAIAMTMLDTLMDEGVPRTKKRRSSMVSV